MEEVNTVCCSAERRGNNEYGAWWWDEWENREAGRGEGEGKGGTESWYGAEVVRWGKAWR